MDILSDLVIRRYRDEDFAAVPRLRCSQDFKMLIT